MQLGTVQTYWNRVYRSIQCNAQIETSGLTYRSTFKNVIPIIINWCSFRWGRGWSSFLKISYIYYKFYSTFMFWPPSRQHVSCIAPKIENLSDKTKSKLKTKSLSKLRKFPVREVCQARSRPEHPLETTKREQSKSPRSVKKSPAKQIKDKSE